MWLTKLPIYCVSFLAASSRNQVTYPGSVRARGSRSAIVSARNARSPSLAIRGTQVSAELFLSPGGETVGHTDNYNCMRDNIPDVTIKYYDGLPHNICDSVPERCAEDALSFLQSRFPDGFSPLRT